METQRLFGQPNNYVDNPMTVRTTQQQCGQPNNSADNPTTVRTTQQQCGQPNNSVDNPTTVHDPTIVQATQCLLPEPSNSIICPLHSCLPSNTGAQTNTPIFSLLAFIDAHAHVPTLMLMPTFIDAHVIGLHLQYYIST